MAAFSAGRPQFGRRAPSQDEDEFN